MWKHKVVSNNCHAATRRVIHVTIGQINYESVTSQARPAFTVSLVYLHFRQPLLELACHSDHLDSIKMTRTQTLRVRARVSHCDAVCSISFYLLNVIKGYVSLSPNLRSFSGQQSPNITGPSKNLYGVFRSLLANLRHLDSIQST